nr:MAG TPA: Putative transferase, nesg, ydcK, Structural Genomics.38A [Caudoviricetes sp.]
MKKFELTAETIEYRGRTLHKIRAVRDFDDVQKGDLGGWVEKESNLNHGGNCWIYDDAKVFDDGFVLNNAKIRGQAIVKDKAAVIGNAELNNMASAENNCFVSGHAKIKDYAKIGETARISEMAQIEGLVKIKGNTRISGTALIKKQYDFATVEGFGRTYRKTIFYKCADGVVRVDCGCFRGTIEEFKKIVGKTHKNNKKMKREYLKIAKLMELHFEEE